MNHNMGRIGFGVVSSFLAIASFGGTAKFNGSAEVKADADFVQLEVSIVSECFPNSQSVVSANDDVGRSVMDILSKFTNPNNPQDKVLATGGYVERYTNYDINTRTNYCVNTFRKLNVVTLRTSRTTSFGIDFGKIQDQIYKLSLEPTAARIDTPTTYLKMNLPEVGLYKEHWQELKIKAIGLALDNAVQKFKATFSMAGIKNFVIRSYQEIAGYEPKTADSRARSAVGSGSSAPVEFDELSVSSQLTVEFEY